MKAFVKFLIYATSIIGVLLFLLPSGCANVRLPGGGPKDTLPPKIIELYPPNASFFFKDNQIVLKFDKEIDIHDLYNQLLVTPRLKKPSKDGLSYTYKNNRYTLRLNLKIPLEDSTTYTFNFREAIKDVTEKNVAENPVFVFSTGSYVDSMSIEGNVWHLLTNQPGKNCLISLYKADNDTLDVLNSVPDYLTQTDQAGKFKLNHVKRGQYRIYASNSPKGELIVNPSKTAYGFLKIPLDLATPMQGVNIPILKVDVNDFKLQNKKPQGQYFEISFNKVVVDYTLNLFYKPRRFREMPPLYSNLVEKNRVIRVYNTLKLLDEDSVYAQLIAFDTVGNLLQDTLTINFRESNRKKERLKQVFTPRSGAQVNPLFKGILTLNKPIRNVTADSILVMFDSLHITPVPLENIAFSKQRDSVTIQMPFDTNVLANLGDGSRMPGFRFYMGKGACITVDKDSSQVIDQQYKFKNSKEMGIIRGKVTTKAPGFIIQLLDEHGIVVDAVTNLVQYEFSNIVPGSYRLCVLVLENKDAQWNFGNIKKQVEPGPVLFYPQIIEVIANWEIENIDLEF